MADTSTNNTQTTLKGVNVDQLFIEILNKMDGKMETQQMLVVFGVWVIVITIKFVLKQSIKRLCRGGKKKKEDKV